MGSGTDRRLESTDLQFGPGFDPVRSSVEAGRTAARVDSRATTQQLEQFARVVSPRPDVQDVQIEGVGDRHRVDRR